MPENQKGLGDTVERVIHSLSIDRISERLSKLLGYDCKCEKRKDKLNKIFPYDKE